MFHGVRCICFHTKWYNGQYSLIPVCNRVLAVLYIYVCIITLIAITYDELIICSLHIKFKENGYEKTSRKRVEFEKKRDYKKKKNHLYYSNHLLLILQT